MRLIILFALTALLPVIIQAKMPELSPSNFSAASLTVAFDRTIKLTEKNKFRFPVDIDTYNRCYISSPTPLLKKNIVIAKGSQWRSQRNSEWSDWDSKNFSFKLTHKSVSVVLKCELNLAGEIFLYHSAMTKKASSVCAKQGGKVRQASPKTITQQSTAKPYRFPATVAKVSIPPSQAHCVKQVSKLNTSKFKNAFLRKKILVNMELPSTEVDDESIDSAAF
tara:strand:+ start:11622 stop:12287 length:666 start_codon:yes stop_codon:yes gene_type:complete